MSLLPPNHDVANQKLAARPGRAAARRGPVTLLVADDHPIVRQGLIALLKSERGFAVVGEAADGPGTIRLAEQLQPDVLVLDLMMPTLNGLEVARRMARRSPRTRIVVLSMHSHETYVAEALLAGATAYVVKDAGAQELLAAVWAAVEGRRYLSPSISGPALAAHLARGAADPFESLTEREREVLHLTAEGLSGAQVGQRLHISPRTVETHRANVMRKLGLTNQRELVRYALERGFLPGRPENT
jgi:DNA-binding NarL/FixJ family response regulator